MEYMLNVVGVIWMGGYGIFIFSICVVEIVLGLVSSLDVNKS